MQLCNLQPFWCGLAAPNALRHCISTLSRAMLQGEGEEEETDELVSQVLDEIGVNLDSELVGAPGHKQAAPAAAAAEHHAAEPLGAAAGGGNDADDDLQARLNNLRKQ